MIDLGSLISTLAGDALSESDNPLSQILSGISGSDQRKQTDILSTVMSVIQQKGGVGAVLNLFTDNGMEAKQESWVGNASNENLEPDQVQRVLGNSVVSSIAAKLGVDAAGATSIIAAVLPELINQITPGGSVSGEQDNVIAKGLALLSRL